MTTPTEGTSGKTVAELEAELAAAYAAARGLPEHVTGRKVTTSETILDEPDVEIPSATIPPAPPQVRPAAEVWGSTEYDFTCPSGASCRMRKLVPEELIRHGILDKITRLPGIAAEVVEKAEAVGPPTVKGLLDEMPSREEFDSLMDVLNTLVPLVVVQPQVWPVPPMPQDFENPTDEEKRVVGRIYLDSIDLEDRLAIMERAVSGTRGLEAFRKGSR